MKHGPVGTIGLRIVALGSCAGLLVAEPLYTEPGAFTWSGAFRGQARNYTAFAALKSDGTAVTWGSPNSGGDSSPVSARLTGVASIHSTTSAFAALKHDGTVVTWGNSYGNSSSAVANLAGVEMIYSNPWAFAALKSDGTVVSWGHPDWGGDSSLAGSRLTGVRTIYSNGGAFAALKGDGTVVTWGSQTYSGGNSDSVRSRLINVREIFSTSEAFAALKSDATVVTWGSSKASDSSAVESKLTGVATIYSTTDAFAALRYDGTVVTWGWPGDGGDSSAVSTRLNGVKTIHSTYAAFAALKKDGTVITWGDPNRGGNCASVSSNLTNVSAIYSNWGAFAAVKDDGSVVTWGDPTNGGDSESVRSNLKGVAAIYSTRDAFAALKGDGSVVTWGYRLGGGDSSAVSTQLTEVTAIYSNNSDFTALKRDGRVVVWGGSGSDAASLAATTNLTGVALIQNVFSQAQQIYGPVVISTAAADGSSRSATRLEFAVTFSESVTGVDADDFSLNRTGTATGTIASVSGSGAAYTVSVTGVSGNGTIRLDLKASGTGIQNAASTPVAIGRGYSSGTTFTVDHSPVLSAAPTNASVTATSAVLGGVVTSDGNFPIIERGVVVSKTSANAKPAINGPDVIRITGTGAAGAFNVLATNLSINTGYSFAAYAINSAGTGYSPVGTFTTLNRTAPIAAKVTVTTDEDVAKEITLVATDAENDPLTFSIVVPPATGTLGVIKGDKVIYTPAADANGTVTFTYKANDGTADSTPATVTIDVLPVHDTPVALAQTVKIGQGDSGAVTLTASNPDNAKLTYTVVSQPKQGTLSGTAPNLTYRAKDDASGVDSLTFRVNDGTSDSGLATVLIVIEKSSNTAPSFVNLTGRVIRELNATSFRLLARDADVPAQKLTFGLVSGPNGLTVSPDGVVNWTPTEEQGPSTNAVTLRVSDNGIPPLSTTQTITISVSEANTAPTLINAYGRSIFENAKMSVQLIARDTDLPAQKLTFSLVTGPVGLTLNGNGLLEWTPTEEQGPSTNKVVLLVTDDASPPLSATGTFILTVREANAAPVFPTTNLTVAAQSRLKVNLKATDADIPVQVLKYSRVKGPTGLTVSTNGLLEWTPPASLANSTHSVTVGVTDGVTSVNSTFQLVVRPVGVGPGAESKAGQRTSISMRANPDQSLALKVVGPKGDRFRVESLRPSGDRWQPVETVGEIETLGDEVPVVVPLPADVTVGFHQFRLRRQ